MDGLFRDEDFVARLSHEAAAIDDDLEAAAFDSDELVGVVDEVAPDSAGRVTERLAGIAPPAPVPLDRRPVDRSREFPFRQQLVHAALPVAIDALGPAMKIARIAFAVSYLLLSPVAGESDRVDLLLVLAIDASGSTASGDFETQIAGHAAALVDPRVIEAIRSGPMGRIGLAATVWSDDAVQVRCLDWTAIEDLHDAMRAAAVIRQRCLLIGGTTAIGGAIRDAVNQLQWASLDAARQVIDLSANEPSNDGIIAPYRADALSAGIVINGLVLEPPQPDVAALQSFGSLMKHFREEVIGGPGAFVLTATRETYVEALIDKLLREIKGGREGV